MRILFLSDNFPPEYNAPATRTFEHCKEWVNLGAEVTIITCFPNFPKGKVFEGYKNKLYQRETVSGINVIRVWSFISPNSGFLKRTIDFLSYALMSFLAGIFVRCDVIIATSPQFFTAISGCLLSFFKRKMWIMEVRDLWPETISAVGAVKNKTVLNWLEKLELFLYWHAKKIIVVTESFKENMIRRGVNSDKIAIIKNGVDANEFYPRKKNERIVRDLGLQGKFVFGYVGTHGLCHGLDFIVSSVAEIGNNGGIHFLFIGDGAEKEKIIALARESEIKNIQFVGPVKKNEVADYLSVLDVALVPLKKSDTFKSVIPSKIFESTAMSKPILLGVDGESRKIVEKYNAGEFFEPENLNDFKRKIFKIKAGTMRGEYDSGTINLAKQFNRTKLAKDMLEIFKIYS